MHPCYLELFSPVVLRVVPCTGVFDTERFDAAEKRRCSGALATGDWVDLTGGVDPAV